MTATVVAALAATVIIVFLNLGISSPLRPIIKCYHSNFTVFSQGMTWASQSQLRKLGLVSVTASQGDAMTPANPVVNALLTAINAADRRAFLDLLTPDAVLSDDGRERALTDWIDKEIFSVHGHMTVDREEQDGLRLLAHFRNDTWGEMSTFWRFELSGDKISRIETGQAT
jgi:hypothetical protein